MKKTCLGNLTTDTKNFFRKTKLDLEVYVSLVEHGDRLRLRMRSYAVWGQQKAGPLNIYASGGNRLVGRAYQGKRQRECRQNCLSRWKRLDCFYHGVGVHFSGYGVGAQVFRYDIGVHVSRRRFRRQINFTGSSNVSPPPQCTSHVSSSQRM
ncbi:hypothetical protein X798_02544 [Onchocerca flexuosa]|uniref:SRCR domain-containing protein n=2 Tax=Onchocerca flexuosa TaxID=387005 RepID=A0A183HZZ9_9BILA|nr:hypothetical protein X798_02544 [Onchocerca flexuosa]VDP12837.1 unnamed protein product [Onchocerca flexuosa]